MRKRLYIIGCTGSVGSSVLSVCRSFPEHFEIAALAANSSVERMIALAEEFSCPLLVFSDHAAARRAKEIVSQSTGKVGRVKVLSGEEGLREPASSQDIDHVVVASLGIGAVGALMQALRSGKEVSLANKESIVAGGPWIMPLAKKEGQLRPLDSEHNAIWQCLSGESASAVKKIYLTASGGPFLNFSREELDKVTPAMAVAHPVWSMGAKISVDSASLMNKGIEILEAMYLFSLSASQVDAVVAPNPFIHGIVLFSDGFMHGVISPPDMKYSLAYCLSWPARAACGGLVPLDLRNAAAFTFAAVDDARFPSPGIARRALEKGMSFPAVLNAADEVAVELFLEGKITFSRIPALVEEVLDRHAPGHIRCVEDVLDAAAEARESARFLAGG